MRQYQRLRLILGDQLNASHSWYREHDDQTLYVIAELHQEASYCRHHIQKLCGFFAAMEQFANALKKAGHHVLHLSLDDTAEDADLNALLQRLCRHYAVSQLEYQQPDEYRVHQQLQALTLENGVQHHCVDSEHFMLPFAELGQYFTAGKAQKMEFFYRKMRKRFHVLMDGENGDEPRGGRWNYDADNRNKLSAEDLDGIPEALCFANPVGPIRERIARHNIASIGQGGDELPWPITRQQALQLLTYFCEQLLPNFGRFQDAMTARSEHRWSLYHSRLAFAMNSKLLSPKQVIDTSLNAFERSDGAIDIAQIEGFIRQILGWREFVRGVYWANMPNYGERNALNAQRPLPRWYWNGETHMHCLKQAIDQSLEHAYAHHIQRLMVTGNFALLAGIHPDAVDSWYLGIYIDALEWVEMPNTRGMSQYADGGLVASKAYAASGNYMNKMSDYCGDCHYKVKEKTGERSCPLNSLYWHFMLRHRENFARNPRVGMVYKSWDKMADDKQQAVLQRADWCLENIDTL